MKYCETKGSGLSKEQLQRLEDMAKDASYEIRERGGLEVMNWDRADFPEISIGAMAFSVITSWNCSGVASVISADGRMPA